MLSLEPSNGSASSLTSALQLLRDRWWVLFLCVVFGATASLANDSRKDKEYQATATLLFGTAGSNVSGLLNTAASNISADPQRDQSTTLLLVASSAVANRVKVALHYSGPSADLGGAVTASARADANLIDITAADTEPARAAQLANAFAQQYEAFRRDADRAGLRQGITSLSAQLDKTPLAATVQRQNLRNSITALLTSEALATGGVQLVDQATEPSVPASPRPKRDALLGVILGLALGSVLVTGIDLLDRRLKSVADFEAAYQQNALVAVPQRPRAPRTAAERQAVVEPFRILRVSLAQASTRRRAHVILVTSAIAGEGKSTTAVGLARAVALAGQEVALVELDLRRPTFHQQFDLPREGLGTASLLQGAAGLDDVLVFRGQENLPNLAVLPAGGLSARSSELLSGPLTGSMLSQLADRFDVVVLDAPPLLPVADTHAMLDTDSVDTCLIVAKAYLTTREQAVRARTILHQHGRTRYGLVVNGIRRDEGMYEYEYGVAAGGELPVPNTVA